MNNKVEVKICGLTEEKEVLMLENNNIKYAGIVMFYERSRRNNSTKKAKIILNKLKHCNIQSVAVMVSPTIKQIKIIEELGFDIVQIHGELSYEVLKEIKIPILRAFNITNVDQYFKYSNNEKISGYVFDGANSGSGQTFDWSIIEGIERDNKLLFLAGGLNEENIEGAVHKVLPNVVDISSGAEDDTGKKSEKRIENISKIVERINEERN